MPDSGPAAISSCRGRTRPIRPRAVLSALSVFVLAGQAAAQLTWDGDAGDQLWFSDSNWSGDQVPTASDRVIVGEGFGEIRATGQLVEVTGVNIQSGLFLDNTDMLLSTFTSEIRDLRVENTILRHITTNSELRLVGAGVIRNHGLEVRSGGPGANFNLFGAQVDECTRLVMRDCTGFLFSGRLTVSQSLDAIGTGSFVQSLATVELRDGASISGMYRISFGNGTLAMLEQGVCNINGPFRGESGTIDAHGEMRFNNDFTIDGTAIAANGNGSVGFFGGSAQRTFRPASITGNGVVEATAAPLVIPADFITALNNQYGLILSGDVTNNAVITNDGTLTLSGTRLIGTGSINSTGTLEVLGSARLDTAINVTGGEARFHSSFNLDATLDVQSDATARFLSPLTIQRFSGSNTGQIALGGTTILPSELSPADVVKLDLPSTIGGIVQIARGALWLNQNTTWQSVQVDLTSSTGNLLIRGGSGVTHTFQGLSTISGPGFVAFGEPVVGARPSVQIGGILTVQTNGLEAKVQCPLQGGGIVNNQGLMSLRSPSVIGVELNNIGTLSAVSTTVTGSIINSAVAFDAGLTLDGGTVLNADHWTIDGTGTMSVTSNGGTFTNSGTFTVANLGGSSFNFTCNPLFVNIGTVRVRAADAYFNNIPLSDVDALSGGGQWTSLDGGHIYFQQAFSRLTGPGTQLNGNGASIPRLRDVNSIEDGASASYDGNTNVSSLSLDRGDATIEEGTLNAAGSVSAQNGSSIEVQSGGTLQSGSQIDVGSESQPSIIDDLQGVVTLALPRGTPPPTIIAPIVNIYGRLTPSASGFGQMNIIGALMLHGASELVVGAESTASHDVLAVTGPVMLGGTLVFDPAPGSTPDLGETITLITATDAISGAFARLDAPTISPSLAWAIRSDAHSLWVEVIAHCQADTNHDGSLDFFDVQTFLNAYSLGDFLADFNNDTLLDFFDVQLFLSLFSAGCP